MTRRECLTEGIARLRLAGVENPSLDAKVLLCHALDIGEIALITDGEVAVSSVAQEKYLALITRRAAFEPVAYITGHKEFMGLDFIVSPDVLIPRSDTESVVEAVLDEYVPLIPREEPVILDICCGSGAIGLSLAKFLPQAKVTLSDISEKALAVTRSNAVALKLDGVDFILSDLFTEFPQGEHYDLIVSNPPYISLNEMLRLPADIGRYEPHLALAAEDEGFAVYNRILAAAGDYLTEQGLIVFEIGNDQEDGLIHRAEARGFVHLGSIPDLTGAIRGIAFRKIH